MRHTSTPFVGERAHQGGRNAFIREFLFERARRRRARSNAASNDGRAIESSRASGERLTRRARREGLARAEGEGREDGMRIFQADGGG